VKLGVVEFLDYWRRHRWVVSKRRNGIIIKGCVKFHKDADHL